MLHPHKQAFAAPIAIRHIDLAEPGPVAAGAGPTLYVFWRRDVPVGQHYAVANDTQDPRALAAAAGIGPQSFVPANAFAGRVSVVVCTRDRPEQLARCLAALPQQSRPPDEVIVVDNASRTDETRRVAENAGAIYVREDRPGLDYARNTGARAAHGDVIAYTDDDVVVHARWLERLADAFDEERVWAVTGLVLPGSLQTDAECHFERHWGFGRGYLRKDFDTEVFEAQRREGFPAWDIGAGASMAFRRETFERVGYFDERLDVGAAGCSGDSEFWYRILSRGGVCRYEPAAVVFHFHRTSVDALARQIRAYMRGNAASLLVQFERTGDLGNLRHLCLVLPAYYARRLLRCAVKGPDPGSRFLAQEIVGSLSGVLYYLRAPRPLS